MATKDRLISIVLVAAAISGQAWAAVDQPSAFDTALENADYAEAAKELDKLAAQGPFGRAANKQLDQYYGRFLAALGQGAAAEPYLVRAIASSGSRMERDRLSFELARSREVDGFVGRAEADYQRLAKDASEPTVRRDAILSLARLRLGANPQGAIDLLTPLSRTSAPAADRWEAHLLMSRAYAILNQQAEARVALQEAWKEAPMTSDSADAIVVTASDQAIDRAAVGDRKGAIGLIALGESADRFAGTAQLPVCGTAVRPEDSVVVAVTADRQRRPIYSAVRASRPGIAQMFTLPLAIARQRVSGSALYVTLRCRTALDPNVRILGGAMRDLSSWLAEKGSYPPSIQLDERGGDPLTQLKAQLEATEIRARDDQPSLVPTLVQLALIQGAQSRFGNPSGLIDAKAYADRAVGILMKAGAPEEVLQQVKLGLTVALAQNGNIADVAGPAAAATMSAIFSRPESTPAQALAAYASLTSWQLKPAQQLELADTLIKFLDDRKIDQVDPIRQVAELRRALAIRNVGTTSGLAERLTAHGLPADICSVSEKLPSIPPSAITLTSDDYPKDLIRRDISGLTAIEMSISATGKVEKTRVIASQPSDLFDTVAAGKLANVTLLPAQQNNAAVACRGMVQNVRWQLPPSGDFSASFAGYMPFDD